LVLSLEMGLAFLLFLPTLVSGHASLIDPPSRAAMNMYGFPENPPDYQHNEGFCGGFAHQFSAGIGGKCGICGDAWDASPREHEAPGGKYANGIIVRTYQPGQDITVTVLVTANHKGYFTFKLCRNDNVNQDPDQSCFEQEESLLRISPTGDLRFMVTTEMGNGPIDVKLRLPDWQCEQCILQWTYTAGNSWGQCPGGGGALGCGPQETFRSCADITIAGQGIIFPTLPPITLPPPSPVPSPSPSPSPIPSPSPSPSPLPSPSPSPPPYPGQTCVAVGAWAGDTAMANWCFTNCFHTPPYCPSDRCSCIDSAPVLSKDCIAVGAWIGNSDMDNWCHNNCNAPSPYCPSNMCHCVDGVPSPVPSPSPIPSPSPAPSPSPIPSPSPSPAPSPAPGPSPAPSPPTTGSLIHNPTLQLLTLLISKLVIAFITTATSVMIG